MIKTVANPDIKIKPPTMLCDDVISNDIPYPLDKKNFVYVLVGAPGSGKTSFFTSILCEKKKPFKAYRGKFDEIILNMPKESAASIKGNPFGSLPSGNIIAEFDEKLLNHIYETAQERSAEGENTLAIIDDASSKLKTNRKIIDLLTQLVHKHRHLRLSLMIAVQDYKNVPLSIRKGNSSVFYWRPVNEKSNLVMKEELLPAYSQKELAKLMDEIFKKKGDFLQIKLNTIPYEYFKNFEKIILPDSNGG